MMIEQKNDLLDARKLISEQDARIKKLEEIVYKKGAWDSEVDEKGSCSVKLNQSTEPEIRTNKNLPNYEYLDDGDMQVVDKSVFLQLF